MTGAFTILMEEVLKTEKQQAEKPKGSNAQELDKKIDELKLIKDVYKISMSIV